MSAKTNGSGKQKHISLTVDELRKIIYYDPETGGFYRLESGKIAGCEYESGYVVIQIYGHKYFAHELAWFYMYGEWAMVDHKDTLKPNNRLENLRKTTNQLNSANRSYIYNNSGAKGVYFRNGKYEAGIKVNQKRIYLGQFKTLEEAKAAYAKAAIKYFGEFANVG